MASGHEILASPWLVVTANARHYTAIGRAILRGILRRSNQEITLVLVACQCANLRITHQVTEGYS